MDIGLPEWLDLTLVILCALATLLPYPFYTWAYKWPRSLYRYVDQKHFVTIAQYTKLLNVAFALPTLLEAEINKDGIWIGLPLMFIGQYLVLLVYSVLGDAGVYYGLEYHTISKKKIEGFPFNMSDPMYKGSVLSVLGLFFLVKTNPHVIMITIPWMISYFYEICVENTVSAADVPAKKRASPENHRSSPENKRVSPVNRRPAARRR